MKKFLTISIASIMLQASMAQAQEDKQYPYVSGQILSEFKTDRVLSTTKQNTPASNSYFNVEPDFSFNIDKSWSVKTGWRIFPTMQDRNGPTPERSRTILQDNRGFHQDDTALIIEELKGYYQNDDMKAFFGKFNPTFATLYRKSKRIGVFLTDFTEDYELREKIGGGVAAMLEDSEITFNTFFNDPTGLSGSALKNRGTERANDGLAGNTSSLSSYSATMEGERLFGVENLFYNIGYRSLGVKNNGDNKRETGYTLNLEYLEKITQNTSVIPIMEYVKIANFTGLEGRNAEYKTFGLIGKYSAWSASLISIKRNIDKNYLGSNSNDSQLQFTAGYKFTNNLAIDVSRMNLKEDNHRASMVGIMFSYLYKF